MPAPSTSLRPALVLWLYAAAIVHILAGLTLTWAGIPDYSTAICKFSNWHSGATTQYPSPATNNRYGGSHSSARRCKVMRCICSRWCTSAIARKNRWCGAG